MSRTILIGLLGRAGSGKSTAARHLEQAYAASLFSFAGPLKELAGRVMGFSPAQLHGSQAEKEAIDPRYGMSPREFLIRLGDGAREILGRDVWIDACMTRITFFAPRLAVIEDVRYPNEARAIAAGGHVIKLVCPDRASDPSFDDAPSERGVDEVDPADVWETIVSPRTEGSVDLKARIDAAMRRIL